MEPDFSEQNRSPKKTAAYQGSRVSGSARWLFANPYQKIWAPPATGPANLRPEPASALRWRPAGRIPYFVSSKRSAESRRLEEPIYDGAPIARASADYSSKWHLPDRAVGGLRTNTLFRLFPTGQSGARRRTLFDRAARKAAAVMNGRYRWSASCSTAIPAMASRSTRQFHHSAGLAATARLHQRT